MCVCVCVYIYSILTYVKGYRFDKGLHFILQIKCGYHLYPISYNILQIFVVLLVVFSCCEECVTLLAPTGLLAC